MDNIELFLGRLHADVRSFVIPSAAPWDVPTLKAQIELRQGVLRDIEIIRRRLRPLVQCQSQRRSHRTRRRPGCRSPIGHTRRP